MTERHSVHEKTEPILLSIPEAAKLLGVGRSLTYDLLGSGALKSVHIGRRRLVVRDSIYDYVRRLGA